MVSVDSKAGKGRVRGGMSAIWNREKQQAAQKTENQSRLSTLYVLVHSFRAEICDNSFIETINDQWWKWLKLKTTQRDNFIEKVFLMCKQKREYARSKKKFTNDQLVYE